MDQLTAHLDRGWDLAQRGDVHGAQASAKRAIELSPSSPECYNLLGFVAALDGDCDEALEAYQHAAMLDDTYVEAMLNAAELLVHPIGDFDEAYAMCAQVLDVTEFEDEILDAKLLQIEASLSKGDKDRARRVLRSLPTEVSEDPTHNYLTGRAHFEVGQQERAGAFLDAALAADPSQPAALYYRGLLFEHEGDRRSATLMFLHVREAMTALGPPAWAPNADTVLMFTEKAVKALTGPGAELLRDASLYIVDLPGSEMVVDGVDVQSPILIEVVPDSPEEPGGFRVFLYLYNILRIATGIDNVQSCIQTALETELQTVVEDLEQLRTENADVEALLQVNKTTASA